MIGMRRWSVQLSTMVPRFRDLTTPHSSLPNDVTLTLIPLADAKRSIIHYFAEQALSQRSCLYFLLFRCELVSVPPLPFLV